MTAVMSAANEKAVEVFLREEIAYLDIVPLVSACCEAHKVLHCNHHASAVHAAA